MNIASYRSVVAITLCGVLWAAVVQAQPPDQGGDKKAALKAGQGAMGNG